MPKTFTEDEVLAVIRKACDASSQKDVAASIGVSAPYLSSILLGKFPVSDSVAASFGFEREVITQAIFRKVA